MEILCGRLAETLVSVVILLCGRLVMVTANRPLLLLRQRLGSLNRRIYASLPWGFRVSELLVHLAADGLDAFGRSMYAEFIKAAVRGMPDAPSGRPAFDLIQDVHHRGPSALPPGYGKPFASRVYKILLSKFGSPEIAEEAMSAALLQVARGKLHVSNGAPLHAAESLAITVCLNAARDLLRAQGRRREDSLVRDNDEALLNIDVEDPTSFERLDKLLPASDLARILRSLKDVHHRAPEWLRARLDGESGQDIAEQWGTTPSYVSKFQRVYLPRIRQVLHQHLREARVCVSS
jgi:DNA-directed RNA polymerase specialized sigma24 family protein